MCFLAVANRSYIKADKRSPLRHHALNRLGFQFTNFNAKQKIKKKLQNAVVFSQYHGPNLKAKQKINKMPIWPAYLYFKQDIHYCEHR